MKTEASAQFEFEILTEKSTAQRPKEFPRTRPLDEIETRYRMAAYECRTRKKNNFEWRLSIDEFRAFCSQPCWYCDGKLGKVKFGKGLDRIDSSQHYTVDNVYPCCNTCNRIKGHDLTSSETKLLISILLNYRRGHK